MLEFLGYDRRLDLSIEELVGVQLEIAPLEDWLSASVIRAGQSYDLWIMGNKFGWCEGVGIHESQLIIDPVMIQSYRKSPSDYVVLVVCSNLKEWYVDIRELGSPEYIKLLEQPGDPKYHLQGIPSYLDLIPI